MINCRSVAPLQDTPSNKLTYSAQITVPKEFVVTMSANMTEVNDMNAINATHKTWSFESTIKIPTYLIALAIGDLEYR